MILKAAVTLLMFCEAGMLSMLGDTYAVPVLVVLATLYLFIRPLQFEVSLGTKILVPAALVGFFFIRYLSIGEISGRSEWVFPTRITVSLAECFLLGQIFELIKRRNPDDGLLNFSMLAMAVVVCCCCRTAFGLESSLLFLGSVVCITLICTIFQYSTRTFIAESKSDRPAYTYRFSLISATIVMVGTSSWYLSGSLRDNIELFQTWWIRNFQVAGLSFSETSIGYTHEATLRNITRIKNSNPLKPALRIFCEAPPGYLRGRAFDRFNGFQWFSQIAKGKALSPIEPPEKLSDLDSDVYRISDAERGRFREVEIKNQTSMSYFFLPLNSSFVAGQSSDNSRLLRLDRDSVVIRGVSQYVTYSGFVNEIPPVVKLVPYDERRLTKIPDTIEPEIPQLARTVTAADQTDSQRIASIEKFFNENYEYSIEQKEFPKTRDPLSYFITERPAAHCEFFATAAVVFLRSNGIPARYVTGFATNEMSSEENYYVARNKDAHAWAEAYDREKKRWVIVEATPDTDLPRSVWEQETELDVDLSDMDGGTAETESNWTWSSLVNDMWLQLRVILTEIGNQLRGPLNILLVSLFIVFLFYHYWWKRFRTLQRLTHLDLLEKERAKVEKTLSRFKIDRQKNETMYQFEKRLNRECKPKTLELIAPIIVWFRQYEASRFGPDRENSPIPLSPKI